MRVISRGALLILMLPIMTGSVPPPTQVAEAGGAIGTGALIDQIAGKLSTLVDKATASGDFLAMRAGQEALYVLDGFKKANADLLDDAFDRIGRERQAVLNALQATARSIEEGRIDTLEKLQASGDQLDCLVRDVAFKSRPVIYRYRGSIVTPGETQDVRLAVNGFKLNGGQPHLIFRGQRIPAQIEGDTLRFTLPRNLFAADADRIKSENATLVLFYRSGGFLGFGGSEKEDRYSLNVITLPARLASIELTYAEEVSIQKEEVWGRVDHRRRSGRGGWDCHNYAYSPTTAARRFDPART